MLFDGGEVVVGSGLTNIVAVLNVDQTTPLAMHTMQCRSGPQGPQACGRRSGDPTAAMTHLTFFFAPHLSTGRQLVTRPLCDPVPMSARLLAWHGTAHRFCVCFDTGRPDCFSPVYVGQQHSVCHRPTLRLHTRPGLHMGRQGQDIGRDRFIVHCIHRDRYTSALEVGVPSRIGC